MSRSVSIIALPVMTSPTILGAETLHADVWAGNRFGIRLKGHQVAEDRVSILTKRSVNAKSFSVEARQTTVHRDPLAPL